MVHDTLAVEAVVPAGPQTETPTKPSSTRAFLQEVRTTVRGSLREARAPAAFSFVVGMVLIALYYGGGEATRPGFEWLAELKAETGLAFSVASTCLFGGLLPTGVMLATRQLQRPYWANVTFNLLLWALIGFLVDELYQLQSFLHGDKADAPTVVRKVLFDQFVWNPFFAVPLTTFLFRWRDHGFPLKGCQEVLRPSGLLLSYCSSLLTCWGSWLPGTSVVYAFPAVLQIPAFNVILFSYAILISVISQRASSAGSDATTAQTAKSLDTYIDSISILPVKTKRPDAPKRLHLFAACCPIPGC